VKLLAIDPASNKCGVAIFENERLKKTLTLISKANTPLSRRLDIIYQLVPFIATADIIVSEEPMLLGRNNNGMQRLLGMIEKISEGQVVFYHPMTIKASLKSGSADKLEVGLAAGELLIGRSAS
jgi:Holliday junction resolvasome RuvABC endonuclease subunit